VGRRKHTPEDIINKLREAEVELARGLGVPEVCRKAQRDGVDPLPLAEGHSQREDCSDG